MVGIRFGFNETLYPVLTSLPEGEAVGDRQPKEEVFLSSGTWTHPGATTITHVDVLLVGGGGGGGGGTYSPTNRGGGAGGGGGVRRMSVPVSSSPGSYTVTIGANGSKGPQGADATAGGVSSFGSSAIPALTPTSHEVGGGGLGRGGGIPSPSATGATLADAVAEGGGGGSQAASPEDGGVLPWTADDPMGPRRGGKGGTNGFPADPYGANGMSGGAGGQGGHTSQYQSGVGLYGYGGGGAGKGTPASNNWHFPFGAIDGGGIGPVNSTIVGPGGINYPWYSWAVTNTGGGGGAGIQLNWNPTSPTYAQGGGGGSGLCVVRWWE
jgi:hypothetical protein